MQSGITVIRFNKTHTRFHVTPNKVAIETPSGQFYLLRPRSQYCKKQYQEVIDLIEKRQIRSLIDILNYHTRYIELVYTQRQYFYDERFLTPTMSRPMM